MTLTKCKECGKRRKIPKQTYASRAAYECDPYCSRVCCEKAHGIVHAKGHNSLDYKVPA